MTTPEFTIGIIVAVAAAAFFMKAFTKKEPDQVEELLRDAQPEPGDIAALSSDGIAFIPRGSGIALVVVGRPSDPELAMLGHKGDHAPPAGETLVPGELIAARVRRGAPDHDPYRLEALGREREYRAWRFETEEAAHAALTLVEDCIVRPPLDEDGEPVRIGDADFAEARRIEEETERELASGEPFEDEEPDRGR